MRSYFIILLLLYTCNCIFAKKKINGLQIITEFKPQDCSQTAAPGDTVAVHYTGKLENGQIFDSSVVSKREPIKFELGMGKVIQGWDKGIMGMCIGEKRKLVIPPELAYGENGVKGVIPPQATLTFETELIELVKPPVMSGNTIQNTLSVLLWPAIIMSVLFVLYKRITAADEKIKSEKSDKKSRKKKH